MDKAEFVNLYIKNLVDSLVEMTKASVVADTEKQWKDLQIENLTGQVEHWQNAFREMQKQSNEGNDTITLKDNQLSQQDQTILALKNEIAELTQQLREKSKPKRVKADF
jgi:peptidoglycan hydrolase CwlO-like protein